MVTTPAYLKDFKLTVPGYNNGGLGQRVYYVGEPAAIAPELDVINRYLGVMAFASNADRTNTVGAGLTVMLRNRWPGARASF